MPGKNTAGQLFFGGNRSFRYCQSHSACREY